MRVLITDAAGFIGTALRHPRTNGVSRAAGAAGRRAPAAHPGLLGADASFRCRGNVMNGVVMSRRGR